MPASSSSSPPPDPGDSSGKVRPRRWPVLVLASVLALVCLIGGAAVLLWHRYTAPGPSWRETVVEIPQGAGVRAIADQLKAAGVIADPYTFVIGVRTERAGAELKAGEYAIPIRASMAGIVALLRSGKVVLHRITVPEGLTSAQIVALIDAEPALSGAVGAIPAEGTLLPETYYFARGMTRAALIDRMRKAQEAALDRLWPQRDPGLPLSRDQAVVLASIVEKETAVAAERPRVAGVYLNRLRQDMRLESDPTVIYGLTGGKGPLGRPLTYSDLDKAGPYNTYRKAGLPPTPIANPGLASLRAVLNPAKTGELYFVADGTGGHAFSETWAGHTKNVANWRRLNAKPKKSSDQVQGRHSAKKPHH